MQKNHDTTTIYVAASLANLLTCFLDQRQLALPALRERLTRLAQGPRMPITIWWALLDDIQQACPDEAALGLQIGSCAQPHHIGVLGYLAMYSNTLGQALLRFSRFQPLLHNLAPSLISRGIACGRELDQHGHATRHRAKLGLLTTCARALGCAAQGL